MVLQKTYLIKYLCTKCGTYCLSVSAGEQKGGLRHILDGNGKTPDHASDFQKAFACQDKAFPVTSKRL
jgi:hypothetical protein